MLELFDLSRVIYEGTETLGQKNVKSIFLNVNFREQYVNIWNLETAGDVEPKIHGVFQIYSLLTIGTGNLPICFLLTNNRL